MHNKSINGRLDRQNGRRLQEGTMKWSTEIVVGEARLGWWWNQVGVAGARCSVVVVGNKALVMSWLGEVVVVGSET